MMEFPVFIVKGFNVFAGVDSPKRPFPELHVIYTEPFVMMNTAPKVFRMTTRWWGVVLNLMLTTHFKIFSIKKHVFCVFRYCM